jgi:predicted DNA-binding transcriptional regulator AlpA
MVNFPDRELERRDLHGTTPVSNRWLRPAQVARLIGFSTKTLRNWRYLGRGPRFVRLSRTQVRYRLSDVVAWMREHEI